MAEAHEFSIPVRDLDAAGKPLRFRVRPAWIRGAFEATDVVPAEKEGVLEVRLSKSGTDVVVRGTVQAELTVPCARCLQPTRVTVKEPISALAVPGQLSREEAHGDEDDLVPDQADMIPYDGETVVLDDLVRDELLLGIPMIPLCSEGCPGIQPQLAEQPEEAPGIDPRLRPLLRLKKSLT